MLNNTPELLSVQERFMAEQIKLQDSLNVCRFFEAPIKVVYV